MQAARLYYKKLLLCRASLENLIFLQLERTGKACTYGLDGIYYLSHFIDIVKQSQFNIICGMISSGSLVHIRECCLLETSTKFKILNDMWRRTNYSQLVGPVFTEQKQRDGERLAEADRMVKSPVIIAPNLIPSSTHS